VTDALTILLGILLLWLNQAQLVGLLWMIRRKITGEYVAYWPSERGFWRETWINLRVGLLWPWLIAKRLKRIAIDSRPDSC